MENKKYLKLFINNFKILKNRKNRTICAVFFMFITIIKTRYYQINLHEILKSLFL